MFQTTNQCIARVPENWHAYPQFPELYLPLLHHWVFPWLSPTPRHTNCLPGVP